MYVDLSKYGERYYRKLNTYCTNMYVEIVSELLLYQRCQPYVENIDVDLVRNNKDIVYDPT